MKAMMVTIAGTDISRVGEFMKLLEDPRLTVGTRIFNIQRAISEVQIKQADDKYDVSFTIAKSFKGNPSDTPGSDALFRGILNHIAGIFNDRE